MAESTNDIKIAIIGGGLAGASIANALLRHASQLEVHVYESAPEFSERGAAIGLPSDAQRALAQVVGKEEADALLRRAGAVVQASTRVCILSSTATVQSTLIVSNGTHRDPVRMQELSSWTWPLTR